MGMTIKEIRNKYLEKFGNFDMPKVSDEHRDFLNELHQLTRDKWIGKSYPADIDAATELSNEETAQWLRRLVNLPE